MRVIRPFLFLTLLLLASCAKSPASPAPVPTPTPAITLRAFPASLETQAAIRAGLAKLPGESAYRDLRTGGGYSSLVVQTLVSSGEFETVEISWQGKTVLADILWAYDRTNANVVVPLPVVLGLAFPDQPYAYFSDWYHYTRQPGAEISREAALQDMQERLPRGRVFSATMYDAVTERKVVWEQCPRFLHDQRSLPADVCALGAWVEERNPGNTTLFIQRAEDRFPSSWLLVGWFFAEKTPQSAEVWEVRLPEEQREDSGE